MHACHAHDKFLKWLHVNAYAHLSKVRADFESLGTSNYFDIKIIRKG